MLYDFRSDLLVIAPSARPPAARITMCGPPPHRLLSPHTSECGSIPPSLLPLLQLLLALLRSAEAPGELHTCDCFLLLFTLLLLPSEIVLQPLTLQLLQILQLLLLTLLQPHLLPEEEEGS
jgi:hypothetical protein